MERVEELRLMLVGACCRAEGEHHEEALARILRYGPHIAKHELGRVLYEAAVSGSAMTARMLTTITRTSIQIPAVEPEMCATLAAELTKIKKSEAARTAGQRLLEIARGKPGTMEEVLTLALSARDEGATTSVEDQVAIGLAEYRKRLKAIADRTPRVSFPWATINQMVPYIYPDDMILLSGMSKVGKSSAVHQIALYNASAMKVLYFHNEDTQMKIVLRLLAQGQLSRDRSLAGPDKAGTLDYRSMLAPIVRDEAYIKTIYSEAERILKRIGGNLIYVYCPGWTPEQILAEWRYQRSAQNIGLVVIDYLNKIELTGRIRTMGNVAYAMENCVEVFKREAGRPGFMTPVLLAQQENEDGSVRDTRSSVIKCQVHLHIERDSDGGDMQTTGKISVLRANDGLTGSIPASFYPPYMVWIA